MKKINKKTVIGLILMFVFAVFHNDAHAQIAPIASTKSNESNRAKAKIMVVPYYKQNEDIRTVLDENPNIRTAVSMVKEAFDQRGWSTVDFVANLRAAQSNSAFTADRQSNFKSDLLTTSGADFYVQVDVQISTDPSGTNTTIILQAYETHTGASFANKTGNVRFVSNDNEKLIQKAFEKIQEEFLNTLMMKTDEIIEIGRAVMVEVNLDEKSNLDFDAKLESDEYLNEVIEEWIMANAYKGRANLTGIIENKMSFDEVRIPLFDQETDKPYNPNRFATEIVRFLRTKGVEATRNIHGQKIFVTIK